MRATALRMNRIVQGSLLPVLFAFVSFGTVACSADGASPEDATTTSAAAAVSGGASGNAGQQRGKDGR